MNNNKQHTGPVAQGAIILSTISSVLFPLVSFGSHPTEPLPAPLNERHPNIVIIYADDLGYGDVSCYNPESKIATPNIDRLAANGMLFTDAHSAGSICSPSRYSLLTGRFSWRKVDGIVYPFGLPLIDEDELTLPMVLKEKGYHTALIGKWHLGWHWNWKGGTRPPEEQIVAGGNSLVTPELLDFDQPVTGGAMGAGFDYYFGQDVPNFPPYAWMENGVFLSKDLVQVKAENLGSVAFRGYIHGDGPGEADWEFDQVMPTLTKRAVDYINERGNTKEPFFLMFSTTSPHTPVVPEEKFHSQSQAGYYGDYIVQLDDEVGRIVRALEETRLIDNTLIIFTSDNGPEAIVNDVIVEHGHVSMGPLRGVKWDIYEGGHRIPCIVQWPGVVAPGTVSDALVSQVDIMGTFASLTGYELPPKSAEDSYDLLPLFKQHSTTSPRSSIVHSAGTGNPIIYAIRHHNWILIDSSSGRIQWGRRMWFNDYEIEMGVVPHKDPAELFDLSVDLGQRNNLYATEPQKAKELKALMNRILKNGQVR